MSRRLLVAIAMVVLAVDGAAWTFIFRAATAPPAVQRGILSGSTELAEVLPKEGVIKEDTMTDLPIVWRSLRPW